MMRIQSLLRGALPALVMVLAGPGLNAQEPSAAELAQSLDKLQVLGTVLYVGAHPDDENTALLAYFSRGRNLRTAYLSLNRGGGGQNRIGSERGDLLAAIRTQELLEARKVDGAEQYFTRAVDFGYSKNPEATFAIWGHDPVLADVVWTIRKLRPDVIVSRFSPTRGHTHGHHTASAILAVEAFQAAGDPARFPEQLAWVQPWQATRLVWNSYRPEPELKTLPAGSVVTLDAGGYDPWLGRTFPELGAASYSQHRSQGGGRVADPGPRIEHFELLAGQPAKADLFEGVELGWGRVAGGARAGTLLAQARTAFRPDRPAEILPLLLQAKTALDRLPEEPWVLEKRLELVQAIRAAAGIRAEAFADRQMAAPGDPLTVTATVTARGTAEASLTGCDFTPGLARERDRLPLGLNQPVGRTFQVSFPAGTPCSQPYWLEPRPAPGLHAGGPPDLAGLPENKPALAVTFHLEAQGVPFEFTVPVQFRVADPVLGERLEPLAVAPDVMVNFAQPVQVLGGPAGRRVSLTAVAGKAASGRLRLQASGGWRAEPAEFRFDLARPGDEARFSTVLTPPPGPGAGELSALVETGGADQARSLVRIDYPHIPLQTLFPPARVSLVRLDLKQGGRRIGYVAGAGDEVPASLRPLGYQVDMLTDQDLAEADLSGYDAIVVGIRAFNVRPALARLNLRLMDYVAGGGTEIVQFNVDQHLVTSAVGPYPFRITSDRVTDPRAAVTFLAPDHPALNRPNRITQDDFQGWVQERGTYFAAGWDPRYVPVLATGDAGEAPGGGGLIIATHGRGHFVYTGLGFFRQLPEGVPGAYRLFANLLALGMK